MRLGYSGTWVELHVAGYQFPDLEPGRELLDPDSSDSNWLVIAGSVHTAGGDSWSFRAPALTTWEVADLVAWLQEVAQGAAPAITTVDDTDELTADENCVSAGWLAFTEPNLSFAVSGYAGAQVEVLVRLSHEFAAPPINPQQPHRCEVAVMTDRQQVNSVAAALWEELVLHPVR